MCRRPAVLLLYSAVRGILGLPNAHAGSALHKFNCFSHLSRLLVELSTTLQTDCVDNLLRVSVRWAPARSGNRAKTIYTVYIVYRTGDDHE